MKIVKKVYKLKGPLTGFQGSQLHPLNMKDINPLSIAALNQSTHSSMNQFGTS